MSQLIGYQDITTRIIGYVNNYINENKHNLYTNKCQVCRKLKMFTSSFLAPQPHFVSFC